MPHSQPPSRNHTNGPSRGAHDRDRIRSHSSSHHNNGGTVSQPFTPGYMAPDIFMQANNQQISSQNVGSSQQQTYGTDGYGNYQPANSSQDPRNGYSQSARHDQYGRYVPVPRLWRHQNPEIERIINNPALEVAPSPNAHGYAYYYAPPPAAPAPPPGFPLHGRNTYRLTAANLEEHERRRPLRNTLRQLERQNQRTGPYDAVGEIRRDGQVYEEDVEWSDGYHDYDE